MPLTLAQDGLGRDRRLDAWRRELTDDRDALLSSSPAISRLLPPAVDWFADAPRARDQGADGTCGGHVARSVCLYETYALQPQLRLDPSFDFSPLFPYWYGRVEDGTPTTSDDGVTLRSVFKAVSKRGICRESLLPYGPGRYATTPSSEACADALNHQVLAYVKLSGVDAVKLQLARGFLVGCGLDCPPSLMEPAVAKTGLLPWDGRPTQGGHALTIIGYDDSVLGDGAFRVLNSWGLDFGIEGTFWLSYRYALEGLLADARSVQRIEA